MTKYAAYDHHSIYAIGDSPDEAIATARADAGEPDAKFNTAEISDDLAKYIEENGWNGHHESFDVRDGEIFRTTDE